MLLNTGICFAFMYGGGQKKFACYSTLILLAHTHCLMLGNENTISYKIKHDLDFGINQSLIQHSDRNLGIYYAKVTARN